MAASRVPNQVEAEKPKDKEASGTSAEGSPFKTFDDHLRRFYLKKAKSSMTISRAGLDIHGEKRGTRPRTRRTQLEMKGTLFLPV